MKGKELTCSSTKFQISGIDNFIRFKLVSSGCSVWVVNVISELSYEGNKKKLSEFVVDLNKWNRIKIINKNKHVSFFVDERLIFETTYKQSLGELQGVFLEFEGNGMVKSFDLKTLEGKTLYHF